MGKFATGVAVVTTGSESRPQGMTVNSLTSVPLDPALILVSLMPDARTTRAIFEHDHYAVSILSTRQQDIALRFAQRGEDHFAGLPLEFCEHAVPVVPGELAHVECVLDRGVVAGDHVLMLGRVLRTCDRLGEPLIYYSGQFGRVQRDDKDSDYWFF